MVPGILLFWSDRRGWYGDPDAGSLGAVSFVRQHLLLSGTRFCDRHGFDAHLATFRAPGAGIGVEGLFGFERVDGRGWGVWLDLQNELHVLAIKARSILAPVVLRALAH